jgi:hypothetical protein
MAGHQCQTERRFNSTNDAEHDVKQNAFTRFVDDLAGDKASQQSARE